MEVSNAKQSKEDDAKLPLFFSLLSLPVVCFDAVLLYLTEDGLGSLNYWGHSPLIGFWSLLFYFSFAYNVYYTLKFFVYGGATERTPTFIMLVYILAYQAYLVLSYLTYDYLEAIYLSSLIVAIIGIVSLVFLLFRLFKYFKSI